MATFRSRSGRRDCATVLTPDLVPPALQIAPGSRAALRQGSPDAKHSGGRGHGGQCRDAYSAVTLVNIACSDVKRLSVGENPLKAPAGSSCGTQVIADVGGVRAVADVGDLTD